MSLKATRITFVALLASSLLFQACKKEDTLGIDNDKIIRTPYSLYAGSDQGWLIKTNDAEKYGQVFPADGYAAGAILTYKTNLLLVKQNVHLSENNGQNFNPVYFNVRHFPWQEMIVSAESQSRIYITSKQGNGVAYSEDSGKTWITDLGFEDMLPSGFEISSFTVTADGTVWAFSYKNFVLFKRTAAGNNWEVVTAEGLLPNEDGMYFITSSGNTIYITDYEGKYESWSSEDGGVHWNRFQQYYMPPGSRRFTSGAAEGGPFLVGTDSGGVYRLQGDEMVASNNGLEIDMSVYRIVFKKNIYKNGVKHDYVFIATNKGIYRSEDKGFNWDKMTSNQFDVKYLSMY